MYECSIHDPCLLVKVARENDGIAIAVTTDDSHLPFAQRRCLSTRRQFAQGKDRQGREVHIRPSGPRHVRHPIQ